MPLRTLLCLGLSNKTAPIAVRERAVLGDDHAARLLAAARGDGLARGLVVLSTCGRTEVYADLRAAPEAGRARLAGLLSVISGVDPATLETCMYACTGIEAARHLCRVAAGLDSAVPGEPEILGQVTAALAAARASGATTPSLHRLFDTAIRAGRRARRETAINRGATGLGALPARLAARQFGSLGDRHAIVVGVGEMGQAALTALRTHGTGRLTVANRRLEAALALADRFGGRASCLHGFRELFADADVVVTATAAPEPIVSRALVENALEQRPDRPLFIADLGLPRNVAADVAGVAGVTLHDLDGLKAHVHAAIETRRGEAPRVEAIIGEEIEALLTRERHAAAEPTVRALRREAERVRRDALERTLRHLPGLDAAAREHVEFLTRSLVNRLLHHPTDALRREAGAGNAAGLAEATRALFGLGVPSAQDVSGAHEAPAA